jgi:hypothetical protein
VKRLLLVLAACGDHRSITSCASDLHGVYVTPAGQTWMMLDNRATLEAYPMFDDGSGSAAPRLIDLSRVSGGDKLDGTMQRRYGDACTGRAPFHVVACTPDGLDVVYAEPASCTDAMPSRAEHWRLLQ